MKKYVENDIERVFNFLLKITKTGPTYNYIFFLSKYLSKAFEIEVVLTK